MRHLLRMLSCLFLCAGFSMSQAGELKWDPGKPDVITLKPTPAKFVRLTLSDAGTESCLDEVEIFSTGGTNNLALAAEGAKASAKSCLEGYAIHKIEHLNDGKYGNAHSWIAAEDDVQWVKIELPKSAPVDRVTVSRDREGRYRDRTAGYIRVETSVDDVAFVTVAEVRAEAVRNGGSATPGQTATAAAISKVLDRYAAMIARRADRGQDVAADRAKLATLTTRMESTDFTQPSETNAVALLNEASQANRELFLSDPHLAGIERVLFVKRHPYAPSHNYSDFMDGRLQGGGGVYVLKMPRTNGRLRPEEAELTCLFKAGQGIARDPTLDWEAKTVWFAYMPNAGAGGYREPAKDKTGAVCAALPESRRWHLYRLPVAGGEAQQVTSGPHHDYYPCVLPNDDLAFVTTRCNMRFLCWVPTTMTLYRMKPDGTGLRAISHNNLSEWGPTVRRDGRIMWTRSEYQDKGADYGHTVWAIRPDGTFSELVYGNNTDHNIMNAMEVPGREYELLATKISHFGDFNGPLCYIDLSKGPYDPGAMRAIPGCESGTSNGGIYRDPYPIATDLLLCSYKAGVQFALYAMDRWGNRELLYQDAAIGCMTPVPVAPRPRPSLIPEVSGQGPATMLVMNVYDGLGSAVATGSVKWLRIVRELPSFLEVREGKQRKETYDDFRKYYASPSDVVTGPSGWPTYCAKEVVGLVPVENDGSARFTVPADRMFYFQALDKDYNEIQRMRSVIQAKSGETRTCLGCHDDRLRTGTPSKPVLALTKPAAEPTPPPWGAGPFWYEKVVQPVMNQRCVSCHGGPAGTAKPDLTATLEPSSQAPASFRALVRHVNYFDMQWSTRHRVAAPLSFGTVKSRLFTVLKDKNHETVQLTADDLHAVKCWIDLNCPLWGDYQHRDERAAGRQQATADPIGFKLDRSNRKE